MTPKRGEVYLEKKDETGKARPLVIISNNKLNGGHSVVAIPFYSQQLEKRATQPWCAIFQAGEGGLDRDCAAKTDEITLIDKLYINLAHGPIGTLDDEQMNRIMTALKWSLDMDPPRK